LWDDAQQFILESWRPLVVWSLWTPTQNRGHFTGPPNWKS